MQKYLVIIISILTLISCDDNTDPIIVTPVEDVQNQNEGEDNTLTSIVPCENGMAGIYPCNGYDLVAKLSF